MENSGCNNAIESLELIQFPKAEIGPSIFPIFTYSGRLYYKILYSSSDINEGTNKPFEFPIAIEPITYVFVMVVSINGIFYERSFSNTL